MPPICSACKARLHRRPATSVMYCPNGCKAGSTPPLRKRQSRKSGKGWATCRECQTDIRVTTKSLPSPMCQACRRLQWATAGDGVTRRRARMLGTPGLNQYKRRELLAKWQKQGRRCSYCVRLADTVDHVVPLARGGTNYEGNLTPACRRCNSSKSSRLVIEWRLGLSVTRDAA